MDYVGFVDLEASWGPAEQRAMERCLAAPGLSPNVRRPPAPPLQLSRTIETEIIPRLLLTHIGEPRAFQDGSTDRITAVEVRDLTRIVLERDVAAALGLIEAVRGHGHSTEAVFLELLGPTARLLGDMWESDLCSFTDVTIGLSRLQQVLRQLSPGFESEMQPDMRGRILLGAASGEQHSFGLSMLESFFRRAGWDVCGGATHGTDDLMALARDEWLDAIGLSLSSDVLYASLEALISALRGASRNRSVFVMVGGRYFSDHPGDATRIGADIAASDAPDALRRADACLAANHVRG